jgi:aspartyl-tRNA(Asn)/glutamyl-tRNA(Gln) amidotransferase subunit A
MSLAQLPLPRAAEALRRGEISPVELARASLARARALNARLNCLLTITEKEALKAATAAEREIRAGHYRGPLHGIPYTAKDIFETAGIRTTCASIILADWIPERDAMVVKRLADAGAILVGKAHLSEFASGPSNLNDHYGPARNPWNLACITGGSSGGSAAAVASGIGLFSIGTDTGGSVRMPAAMSGTFGHKPTFGLLSRHGVVPLSWSLDTVGVLSRNSRDAATVLEIIAGYDARDPGSANVPVERYGERLDEGVRDIRIGLPRELLAEPCDPDVRSAVLAAVEALGRLGAKIEEVSVPWVAPALAISNLITAAETRSAHERWYPREARRYGRHMQEVLLMGSAIGAADYLMALRVRRAIALRTAEVFREIDVIALPTVSVPAPKIGAESVEVAGTTVPILTALRRFVRWASLTGQPALSVPCGTSRDGRPIGLQLIGRMFEDAALLRVAHAYESTRTWTLPLAEVRDAD